MKRSYWETRWVRSNRESNIEYTNYLVINVVI